MQINHWQLHCSLGCKRTYHLPVKGKGEKGKWSASAKIVNAFGTIKKDQRVEISSQVDYLLHNHGPRNVFSIYSAKRRKVRTGA